MQTFSLTKEFKGWAYYSADIEAEDEYEAKLLFDVKIEEDEKWQEALGELEFDCQDVNWV